MNIKSFRKNSFQFFVYIVRKLKISTDHGYNDDFITTYDQVTKAFSKFRNHASIIMIENKKKDDQIFSYDPVTYDDVLKKTTTPKKQKKLLALLKLKFLNYLISQLKL